MQNYKEIFEASLARVGAPQMAQEFYATFYAKFMLTHQDVAEMFVNTDMEKQFGVLHSSLHELVKFSLTHERTDYIVKLAHVHGSRGLKIKPQFYDYWLDALIEAVKEMDSDFEPEVETAWRVILAPGIAFMMSDPAA